MTADSAMSASQPVTPGNQREFGGAEMPEIVVGETLIMQDLAEKRIARRQAEPRHFVDDRDFRVIEDRSSQGDCVAVKFRKHGRSRHDGEQSGQHIGPGRNAGAGLLVIRGRAQAKREQREGKKEQGDKHNGERRKADQPVERQRQRTMHCPAERGCDRQRQRCRHQPAAQGQADGAPKQQGGSAAKENVKDRRHGAGRLTFY